MQGFALKKILTVFGTVLKRMYSWKQEFSLKPKTAEQTQNKGTYNPFVLCQMFTVLVDYGCD